MLCESTADRDLQREAAEPGGERAALPAGARAAIRVFMPKLSGQKVAALVPVPGMAPGADGLFPGRMDGWSPACGPGRRARRSLGVTPCGRRAQCGPGSAACGPEGGRGRGPGTPRLR